MFNLKTGKQASKATEVYLLTVFEKGNSKRDTFVEECQKRGDRFKEPIKKSKISNFSTENLFKKNKSTRDSKVQQAKGTRDVAIAKQIDVRRIFVYPSLPEALCFFTLTVR